MGTRQKNLETVLTEFYANGSATKVNKELLTRSMYNNEIEQIYKQLGGILETYPVNPREYDIILDSLIIELDEENHFNRYRSMTLNSTVYKSISSLPLTKYKDYCMLYENRCRTDVGFWKNSSCEKQFGIANQNGDLNGNGSPRWKQRAFYDYLKDVGCYLLGQKLVRVSIYDKVSTDNGVMLLGDILEQNTLYSRDIYNFIHNIK